MVREGKILSIYWTDKSVSGEKVFLKSNSPFVIAVRAYEVHSYFAQQ